MLDDLDNVFYDVDYESSELQNSTDWTELALHNVVDPAIVFPPNQWQIFEECWTWRQVGGELEDRPLIATGFLVSIQSRDSGIFNATKLGTVHVLQWRQQHMNWGVLESLKGTELPSEMRAGLLRHIFNRRPGANTQMVISYVTPRRVLDENSRPWHEDGASLNWELDHRFAGGARIGREQKWRLYAC